MCDEDQGLCVTRMAEFMCGEGTGSVSSVVIELFPRFKLLKRFTRKYDPHTTL